MVSKIIRGICRDERGGEAPPTLFDYVPADALLVIDESHVTVPQIGAMYKGDRARKENLVIMVSDCHRLLDNRPMKFEEWEKLAPKTIFYLPAPCQLYEQNIARLPLSKWFGLQVLVRSRNEIRPAFTQVDDLMSEINARILLKKAVLVTSLTKRWPNLTDYLREHKIKVRYLHSDIDTVERVEIIPEFTFKAYLMC